MWRRREATQRQTASGEGSESSARLRDNQYQHCGGEVRGAVGVALTHTRLLARSDWTSGGAAKKHAEKRVFDRRVKNYQLKVHHCQAPQQWSIMGNGSFLKFNPLFFGAHLFMKPFRHGLQVLDGEKQEVNRGSVLKNEGL